MQEYIYLKGRLIVQRWVCTTLPGGERSCPKKNEMQPELNQWAGTWHKRESVDESRLWTEASTCVKEER